MGIFYSVVPLALFGAIVWGVIALARRPAGEPFRLSTVIGVYAELLILIGAIMAMVGVANIVKSGLGFIHLAYSYNTFAPFPGSVAPASLPAQMLSQQQHNRDSDLVRGLTLLVIGTLIVAAHLAISHAALRLGGAPWISRMMLVILTAICAVVGLTALAIGVYQWIEYGLIQPADGQVRTPFGESLGVAVGFVPVWLLAMLWLVGRALRAERQRSPAETA